MADPATPVDMQLFASTVFAFAGSESSQSQLAVAWLVRNRYEMAGGPSGPGLKAACLSLHENLPPAAADFSKEDFCRSFAAALNAWAGEKPDPTTGALRLHCHTENPSWANGLTPLALIGSRFYYG